MTSLKNPIIVALDVDNVTIARKLIEKLHGKVGGFKVGPRLTFRTDRNFIKELKSAGIVFFDHKFFDIPSTTLASVKVAAEMGADWVTVHALNGEPCLRELAKLESEIKITNPQFKILAVTVLTSFDKQSLPPIWGDFSLENSVERLAQSAANAGLSTFVCSPHEIKNIKNKIPHSFIVTPGVRAAIKPSSVRSTVSLDDQSRVATASEAIGWGASALVIGRPIVEAEDPANAADEIVRSIT